MVRIVTMFFAHEHEVRLPKPFAAFHGVDLDAFDIQLDDELAGCRYLRVLDQTVERQDLDLLARRIDIARDAEGLVLVT